MARRVVAFAAWTLIAALGASGDAAAKPERVKSPAASATPAAGAPSAPASASAAPAPQLDADEVLRSLKEGNSAFVKGSATHPHQDAARIKDVAAGQKPVVTVLSCSDSRVPPELLFDQGVGDVFTVRVAGNVADTDEMGTIEYGVDHLGTPVLVVMGHTKCGAVTAVVTGAEVHGHIPELVDNIGGAVTTAKEKHPNLEGKDLVEPAIVENVFHSMADVIEKSELVRKRLKAHEVKVVGALYHLEDGSVEWLGEHPDQDALIERGDAAPPPAHGAHGEADKGDKADKHGKKSGKAKDKGDKDKHAKPEPPAEGHAEGEHGEADAASEHKPAAPPPINPIAFAIVAAVGCLAGAVSMKLASRGSEA